MPARASTKVFSCSRPREVLVDYANERLVWDAAFRRELLESVARVGVEIERLLGSAQDIEGAVTQGQSFVVQTRPQAGAD